MRITFKTIPISQVNPAPYNPRVALSPGDPEYEKLKRSIDEFGLVEPLVWNEATGNLVGGHQRLQVLIDAGATEIDVSVVHLSPERERLLNVALNKVQGRWDEAKLAALLDELTQLPHVDVTLTGFDLPDVTAMVASVLNTSLADKDESFDVAAALAEARARPAVTKVGDQLNLGRHSFVCGDSSVRATLQGAVGTNLAGMLFTDPPYNVDYGNAAGRKIINDAMAQAKYERWLATILANVVDFLQPGAGLYVFNGHRQFGPMEAILTKLGVKVSSILTWAKERPTLCRGDYKHQTEFCLYGWLAGQTGRHRWFGKNDQSTLWTVSRDPVKENVHPTQKPLELAERAMRNSSRHGDVVLDPFLGSGTTLIAAERTGRVCVGIELDPHFCDVIVRRYIAFTGGAGVNEDIKQRYALPVDEEVAA